MTYWRQARRPDLEEHPADVVASFVAGVVFVMIGVLLLIET